MSPHEVLQARKHLGLTQKAMACRLGIKLAKLKNWEQGRNAISDEACTAIKWLVAGKIE